MCKKICTFFVCLTVFLFSFSGMLPSGFMGIGEMTVEAAVSYPPQYVYLGAYTANKNLTSSGKVENIAGVDGQKWQIGYVSDGVYNIISADGKYLTASGSNVSAAAKSGKTDQNWKIAGVQKGYDGYYLYYSIINVSTNTALTYYQSSKSAGLAAYKGDGAQKWRLDLYGLQGVAANAKVSGGLKSGTIGGLLGKTVTATNDKQLIDYLNSTEPLTVVVSGTIDMKSHMHTRIRDNKTLVGAYSNQIIDCMFRTNNEYGTAGDNPSDNIVIRNINFLAKSEKGRILVNIWSSRQIWVDHCTFDSQLSYNRTGNGQDEVGKFIWINTPYMDYMDKKDNGRSPDYITLSYNIFKNRFWTVAYGTQNSEVTRDRTSILYNYWNNDIRRCPQIGNGIMHVLNNYYYSSDSKNCPSTQQIIGGDNSNILSENCRFEGFETMNKMIMTGSKEKYTDSGSYNGTSKLNFSNATKSDLNPGKNNYAYGVIDAYNTKGTDTKNFCTSYCGYATAASKMVYLTDSSIQSKYASKVYAAPFLSDGFDSSFGSLAPASAEMSETKCYQIKNVNSGMCLDVDGGKAANGTNVQQWGADAAAPAAWNTWKFVKSDEDGYYYIQSMVGNKNFVLDVTGGKTANGTNIEIYTFNAGNKNQKFMISPNGDGSYKIVPKVSSSAFVEVADASKNAGANVALWSNTNNSCQDWTFVEVPFGGEIMDTSVEYQFANLNSKLYMEVKDGSADEGTAIQQWGNSQTPAAHNTWTLRRFNDTSDLYYIFSKLGNGKYCLVSGGSTSGSSITLAAYNSKNSSMLFRFVKNLDGSYYILPRTGNYTQAVEVKDASTGAGGVVRQWDVNGHNCQKWTAQTYAVTTSASQGDTQTTTTTTTTATAATTASTAATSPGASTTVNITDMDVDAIYIFKNVRSGLVMSVEGGKPSDNANVCQMSAGNDNSHKWTLEKANYDYYYIRSLDDPDYYLCADKNGNIFVVNGSSGQNSMMYFLFRKDSNGIYTIVSRTGTGALADTKVLDVTNASKESGANIGIYAPNGGNNQQWSIVTETTKPAVTTVTTTETTTSATTVTTMATTTTENSSTTPKATTTPRTTTAPTTTTTEPTAPTITGDVDGDGTVGMSDIVAMQRFLIKISDTVNGSADLNDDGKVNVFDLIILKRIILSSL